ncbi:uncharacterized protein VTP21DRAFT_9493 [Calcarisporiella thermophila]|uniref:uncharacterized protein n=1 Tax=Calcarisporiella thermophila TaxID=911321 RepID=UPI0037420BAC
MKDYQREFIKFAIANDVLKFGSYTLKSGRISPYFFNAGLFSTGSSLGALGRFYAAALADSKFEYDVLFGPAYKGIPIVAVTAVSASSENEDIPFAFNRKEKKDHGEGGSVVGAAMKGKRVVVVDDVITAGTAIRESMRVLEDEKATLSGVLVCLDRQERGQGELSAIQEVQRDYNVQVKSIVAMSDIMEYMKEAGGYEEHLEKMIEYRNTYGIKA